MRVVFCGNPGFALPTLNALLESEHRVVGVVCSPDKPSGRGRKIQALPVKERALEAGLRVLQPEKLKDPAFLEDVRALQPDCLVVIAFRILPRDLFAMPRFGSLNVHPSLLPRGRGPAPIRWTLINGETETGVTIIHLNERIDGGDILRQVRTPVSAEEDYGALHDRLSRVGASLLMETLDAFESGQIPAPIVQDESLVTRAPKLTATDFVIDWTVPAEQIANRVRAFSPDPGATTLWNGSKFKVLQATVESSTNLQPGQVIVNQRSLSVGTGQGALCLKVIQPEGRKPMKVGDFLNGRPQIPARLGE